jgi:signal transduction histidine kinase
VKVDANQAIIDVSDNGTGIAPEHIENIFKMFYRGTESSSGSGLGLYIACEALEKIKGKITVTSKVNEGSTFKVTIPNLKEASAN